MSSVVVHSEVEVKPDARERAMELLDEMAVESRTEDGVVDYRVTVDIEDPHILRIIEHYEDDAAFQAHESSDHLERFQSKMAPCLATEAEMTVFEVDATSTVPGP